MKYHIYLFDRNENAVVLSEDLDEKAIDILIELAYGKIFSQQCDRWKATKKEVREKFKKEAAERSKAACQDLERTEDSLRRALRESVVDHVIKLYP